MCVIRVDVEWARGRLFDRDVTQLFQRIVTEARSLRCVDVSVKEEKRQRPNGGRLDPVRASVPCLTSRMIKSSWTLIVE